MIPRLIIFNHFLMCSIWCEWIKYQVFKAISRFPHREYSRGRGSYSKLGNKNPNANIAEIFMNFIFASELTYTFIFKQLVLFYKILSFFRPLKVGLPRFGQKFEERIHEFDQSSTAEQKNNGVGNSFGLHLGV